jgi:hypothetical protein
MPPPDPETDDPQLRIQRAVEYYNQNRPDASIRTVATQLNVSRTTFHGHIH